MRHRVCEWLAAALLLAAGAQSQAAGVSTRMVLSTLPLAGFQYYAGRQVWDRLRVGDPLVLEREPDNPHDPRAVRVLWQGHMLGYVPRAGNETVARLLDEGVRLSGRITHLQRGRSHWARLQFEVVIEP